MISLIVSWLILAFAVWLTARLLPSVELDDFGDAIAVAAVFGLLNLVLGEILFVLFSFVTLGLAWLFAFVTRWLIDALLLKLTGGFLQGFRVDGFGSALLAALVMSGLGTLLQGLASWIGVV